MSHAIDYFSVDSRDDIYQAACDFASANVDRCENPDGTYHGRMTIHDTPILNSRSAAEEWIRAHDRGWYDDHAVRYRVDAKPTAEMQNLAKRIKRLEKERADYAEAQQPRKHQSKLITCSCCGSKLNVHDPHFGGRTTCPVCGKSLLSATVLARLKSYDNRIKKAEKELDEAVRRNNARSRKTRWLVKVEVHC